jgi:alcohol dehydrogenase YqhD (iron-dependent ADH family)
MSLENFTYHNETNMVFGAGSEQQVGELIKALGSKVLLHYGSGSIKANGYYDKIVTSLQDANVPFVELGGVISNPSMALVYEGIELCKQEQVDVILAVGGGSVIDSAKAIAMGVFYDGDAWDFFVNGTVPEKALPIGTVLTIPAAGSESSIATVVTNYELGLKRSCRHGILRPKFAVMNPEVTFTLSPYQSAIGAIDMIGHVIERYFTNTTHVDLIDRMSEGLIRTVIEQAKLVKEDPLNYDARAEIMLAGALAHNGSLGVGREEDWACHIMEYEITQTCGVAHGHGLAMLYPAWMRYVYQQDVKRFAMFANKVFDIPYQEDLKIVALKGIDALEAFYHELGIHTSMKEAGITENDIEPMANSCTNDGTRILGNFVKLTKEDVIHIYHQAL